MGQFANDSMTPAPISVSRDANGNEIASDSPSHEDSTPGMGAFNWGGEHYADDVKYSGGGSSGAGVSRETTTVDNSKSPMKRPENG